MGGSHLDLEDCAEEEEGELGLDLENIPPRGDGDDGRDLKIFLSKALQIFLKMILSKSLQRHRRHLDLVGGGLAGRDLVLLWDSLIPP